MTDKMTPGWLLEAKARGEKIPVLTAYDYPMAKLLDEAGIPVLLVGDSLGMVVLGYPDTTQVTLADMLYHVAAVARVQPKALIVADLPYQTYNTVQEAVTNGKKLIQAGADAVKLEGGRDKEAQVRALIGEGIPVMGHLGMLPQSIREEGGYKMKGKSQEESERLIQDAVALEAAGVFALVLELVVKETAAKISAKLKLPTIGIGSGPFCDGQVLVTPDLIGSFPWFRPKFVQPRAEVASAIHQAVEGFMKDVRKA